LAKQLDMSFFKEFKNNLRLTRDYLACSAVQYSLQNECAVVRIDAIGDYMLWRDQGNILCNYLKSRGLRTVLIANDLWADLAARELNFDEVIPVNRRLFRKSVMYRLRIMQALRRRGFCEVYNPTYSRDLLISDSLVRSCGAPVSVGFDGDFTIRTKADRVKGDRWYSRLVPTPNKQLHELLRNREFVKSIINATAPVPTAKNMTDTVHKQPYFVIAPGAGWQGRQWPTGNFIEIAHKILTRHPHWHCVIVGSQNERHLADSISSSLLDRVDNRVGATTIDELVTIVSSAQIVIANESATGHIAAMHNVPSVVILGGGHFGRFMPYPENLCEEAILPPTCIYYRMDCFGCDWKCIYRNKAFTLVPCISQITPESLWNAVEVNLHSAQIK
jgi:ADP-heptose:LPS heptosyltransferase